MFDIFPKALSSVASFLFPLFASYKALKTGDPAQLTPWLMYWVVLACALLVESWAEFILVWIPFYAYIRLLFLLYLVLPQTQGARVLYQTHIHPWLEDNETAIEDFIASAHDRLKAAGIAYLKRAIELLKTNVFGLPPDEDMNNRAAREAAVAADATPQGYTAALLARFSLPSARWSGNAGAAGADFYSLLASAVTAATAAATGAGANTAAASGSRDGANMTASGTLIPPTVRGAGAKISFIAAQRERLNIVMSALDREADQIARDEAARKREREAARRADSLSLDGGVGGLPATDDEAEAEEDELPTQRPESRRLSGFSALSKSRSEVDFEKIEAESGAEDAAGTRVKRRTAAGTPAASGLSSWMPWGWGAGGGGEAEGLTSGYER